MRLLVTGATGFLAGELILRLRRAGHRVWGLSRHGPDLVGDVTEWQLGLERAPRLDGVIHLAALMSFRQGDRSACMRVNSDGTDQVIYFCQEHNIPRLYHVSTAYVCGDARGTWGEEDFSRGQHFRNPYEESKYWAEVSVRQAATDPLQPLKVTIFRPAILVGRSKDGRATAFEGFYYPLKAFLTCQHFAERRLGLPARPRVEKRLHLPPLPLNIRIRGDPQSTLNLVPVDWVAQKMADLVDGPPGTYHLVNPCPPRNEETIREVCRALDVQGIRFSLRPRHDPLSDLYNRLIRPFSPYLRGEPVFTSSVADNFPVLHLGRIINYWKEHRDGP